MADILEEIVAHKKMEIEQRKRFIQPRQMITLAEQKMQEDGGKVMGGSMKQALMSSDTCKEENGTTPSYFCFSSS